MLYDVESGVAVLGAKSPIHTRAAMANRAEQRLKALSPDRVAAHVDKLLGAVATAALMGLRK